MDIWCVILQGRRCPTNNPLLTLIMSITLRLTLMTQIIRHRMDKDMTRICIGDHLVADTPDVDEEATAEDVILSLEAVVGAVIDR